jgi:hypothetical protein
MTKKCKNCGSSKVQIEVEESWHVVLDTVTKQGIRRDDDWEHSMPSCVNCGAVRDDMIDDDDTDIAGLLSWFEDDRREKYDIQEVEISHQSE